MNSEHKKIGFLEKIRNEEHLRGVVVYFYYTDSKLKEFLSFKNDFGIKNFWYSDNFSENIDFLFGEDTSVHHQTRAIKWFFHVW
jgi:hypothetical protein